MNTRKCSRESWNRSQKINCRRSWCDREKKIFANDCRQTRKKFSFRETSHLIFRAERSTKEETLKAKNDEDHKINVSIVSRAKWLQDARICISLDYFIILYFEIYFRDIEFNFASFISVYKTQSRCKFTYEKFRKLMNAMVAKSVNAKYWPKRISSNVKCVGSQ